MVCVGRQLCTNDCVHVFSCRSTSSASQRAPPGVATMMSGLAASSANCASMESPPTRTAVRRLVWRPNSFTTLWVCRVSSRVGASSTARAPALRECSFNLQGTRQAERQRSGGRLQQSACRVCSVKAPTLRHHRESRAEPWDFNQQLSACGCSNLATGPATEGCHVVLAAPAAACRRLPDCSSQTAQCWPGGHNGSS